MRRLFLAWLALLAGASLAADNVLSLQIVQSAAQNTPAVLSATDTAGVYKLNVNSTFASTATIKIWDGTDTLLVTTAGSAQADLFSVAGTAVKTGAGTASGSVRVELPTDGTGVVVAKEFGNSFTNVAAAATTLVKSGAGVLHLVNVNTLGTIASTITIYDGLDAGGTKIATINSLTLSGAFVFDVAFTTGLCIVSTGTAGPDYTAAYR